jgi:hypothetical protein
MDDEVKLYELSAAFLRRSLHEADLLKLGVLVDENPRILKIHGLRATS